MVGLLAVIALSTVTFGSDPKAPLTERLEILSPMSTEGLVFAEPESSPHAAGGEQHHRCQEQD